MQARRFAGTDKQVPSTVSASGQDLPSLLPPREYGYRMPLQDAERAAGLTETDIIWT